MKYNADFSAFFIKILKIIKEDRIDLTGYSGVNTSNSLQGRFDASRRRTEGYCSNSYAVSYGCNAWAAMSSFANTGTDVYYSSGSVTADSELNIYLNNTYKNSLLDLKYVQTSMSWNVGHAGEGNDTLSVSELEDMERAYTWTGDIALPTKSEYIRANSNDSCLTAYDLYNTKNTDTCRITNYLYKSLYAYWLLSSGSINATNVFAAGKNASVGHVTARNQVGSALPVLYLKSNITLSGSGTNDDNIYKIS